MNAWCVLKFQFQKADSDVDYLSRKLDAEFTSGDDSPSGSGDKPKVSTITSKSHCALYKHTLNEALTFYTGDNTVYSFFLFFNNK